MSKSAIEELFEAYEWIEQVLLFPEGKQNTYGGLANNVHAIFVGLKRDVEGLRKFVAENKERDVESPTHQRLFEWGA